MLNLSATDPVVWETILETYHNEAREEKLTRDAEDVLKLVPQTGTYIDIGSGLGHAVSAIANHRKGQHNIGVDVTPEHVARAIARFGDRAEFICSDAIEYLRTLPESSVAAVTMLYTTVIGYYDPAQDCELLYQIRRVLKEDGVLIVESCCPSAMPSESKVGGFVRRISISGLRAKFEFLKNDTQILTCEITAYTPEVLSLQATRVGLNPRLYADLRRTPLTESSTRFVMICTV